MPNLKTYSIKVMDLDKHKYPEHITAPDEETALQLFIDEYIRVTFVREE